MEITYRVLGTDGKEYGPVTQPQLQSWINDGRLLPESQISRSDDGPWRAANQFAELTWQTGMPAATRMATPPQAGSPQPQPEINGALESQMRSGGSWFYWIAALSAVNTIAALTGGGFRFVIGLSITDLFDSLAVRSGVASIALILTALVLGLFVLFGVFANKRHVWAFIAGMALYAVDTVLAFMDQDWINLAFHVFALWSLFNGMKAALALNKLQRTA